MKHIGYFACQLMPEGYVKIEPITASTFADAVPDFAHAISQSIAPDGTVYEVLAIMPGKTRGENVNTEQVFINQQFPIIVHQFASHFRQDYLQ